MWVRQGAISCAISFMLATLIWSTPVALELLRPATILATCGTVTALKLKLQLRLAILSFILARGSLSVAGIPSLNYLTFSRKKVFIVVARPDGLLT